MTQEQLQQIRERCDSGRPVRAIETKVLLDEIERLQAAQIWIPIEEMLPEPEARVLVCAESRVGDKVYKHITCGMYEDGTVWREESSWNFQDFDYPEDAYDEEKDDWKIPEGWWEYTIYNSDEGNYPIDDFVTHWLPLPEPPKGE